MNQIQKAVHGWKDPPDHWELCLKRVQSRKGFCKWSQPSNFHQFLPKCFWEVGVSSLKHIFRLSWQLYWGGDLNCFHAVSSIFCVLWHCNIFSDPPSFGIQTCLLKTWISGETLSSMDFGQFPCEPPLHPILIFSLLISWGHFSCVSPMVSSNYYDSRWHLLNTWFIDISLFFLEKNQNI